MSKVLKYFLLRCSNLCISSVGVFTLIANASASERLWTQTTTPNHTTQYSVLRQGHAVLLSLGADYSHSTENYNSAREKQSLSSGNSVESIRGALSAAFGFNDEFTGFIDAYFNSVSVNTPAVSASQTTHSDFDLGARFSPQDSIFMFELGATLPTTSAPSSSEWSTLTKSSSAPVSLGIFKYWGSVNLQHQFTQETALEVGLGGVGRTKGYSNLLVPQIHVRYAETRSFLLRAGFKYEYSVYEDAFSNKTTASERSSVLTGGSLIYNSINPSILYTDLSAVYYFTDKIYANGMAKMPVFGKNTAVENIYGLSIGYHFDPAPRYSVRNKETYETFRTYDLNAFAIKVNQTSGKFLIDKGNQDDVRVGDLFDIFDVNSEGQAGDVIRAKAKAVEVGPTRTKLQILESYSYNAIKEGFIVKRISK